MHFAAHEEGLEMGEADPTSRGPLSASVPAPPAEQPSDVELTGHALPPTGPRPRSVPPSRLLIGIAGVVAVAVLAVVFARVFAGGGATPESTVREFFAAWSRGDAATMVKDSTLVSSGEATAHPLWDQRAIASMLNLPQNRRLVTNVQITNTATQGDTTSVTVTMRYNGVPYFMRLDVHQVSGHWQIAMYPSILTVTFPSDSSTIVIDGVPLHGNAFSSVDLDVFPGAHRVHMDGSAIVAPVDLVTAAVEPYKTVTVSPTQTLTPAAISEAHQAIHTWLTQCATSSQLQPGNGCPQYLIGGGTISNVHWTLTNDGNDATVAMATMMTATAQGVWAMSATWDDTDMGYTAHNQQNDGAPFTVTLTWNGSGFDVQLQQ